MFQTAHNSRLPIFAPLLVCLLLIGIFAGCGNVRGETNAAAQLRIDLQGAQWAAYRDGGSVWRPLELSGGPRQVAAPSTSSEELAGTEVWLTITDPKGRYGVASVCHDPGSNNLSLSVQHATLAEAAQVFAGCLGPNSAPGVPLTVSGRVLGLGRGEYTSVYLGPRRTLVDSAAPQPLLELPAPLQTETRAETRYDLVAARYRGDALVPERLLVEPNLSLERDRPLELDFSGPASFAPELGTLQLAGISPDEIVSATVEVVTPNGTRARLGELSSGNTLAYAQIPATRLPGGTLQAFAQSFSYSDASKAGSSRGVERTFGGPFAQPPGRSGGPPDIDLLHTDVPDADPPDADTELSLTLPASLGPVELELRGTGTSLQPAASWPVHPGGADRYAQFYSQIRGGRTLSYALSQSALWASQENTSGNTSNTTLSYTLPDFSRLPAWRQEWALTSEADIFWDVSFVRATAYGDGSVGTVFANRSGVLKP